VMAIWRAVMAIWRAVMAIWRAVMDILTATLSFTARHQLPLNNDDTAWHEAS
jgi:hypothetical protein